MVTVLFSRLKSRLPEPGAARMRLVNASPSTTIVAADAVLWKNWKLPAIVGV